MMKFKISLINPVPLLFVQPTGSGKLLVHDAHSILCHGVSLTIVPVFPLGADYQQQMIDKASQACVRIISIHLDEIKNTDFANEIIKYTLLLPDDMKKSIFLFESPQAIVDKPHWKQIIKDLITQKLLRLVAIDEIQLLVHYGLLFFRQFSIISNTLLRDLKVSRTYTKIPVFFMTITCSVKIFAQL